MSTAESRIALTGIGCRFPGGATGPEATWDRLSRGVDTVREVPADRWDADRWHSDDPDAPGKSLTRYGAFLDEVARFDAARFGISPREAVQMDPQQRLLLEVAWEALEDAGRAPDRLEGSRTGVYLGMGISDYARRSFTGADPSRIDAYAGTGTFSSVAAGRIAYSLGLSGPALAVHTACSSSLVALHLALEALRAGTIDSALVGGVNLLLAPEPSVYFSKLGALSVDGRCRTFDAAASGYGRGEGCGVVFLQRLEDAQVRGDRVRSLVLGSAINHDGRSNGLTAPSASAQQAVIEAALWDAGVQGSQITLIEAHGTGTPLGDPIEATALAKVYGAGTDRCALRSVKTNFGHTEAAAGIAGVIAATLALERSQAPPQLHFHTLNPRIDLGGTRLAIPTRLVPLKGRVRAAVSAFGLAGTNAHVILEKAPDDDRTPTLIPGRAELLVFSASSQAALDALRPQYAERLRTARLEDVSFSAAHGRALLPHRIAVVATHASDAIDQLQSVPARSPASAAPVVFAYTGQGSQYPGMGRELYAAERVFRDAFDHVDRLFRTHRKGGLAEVVYGERTGLLGKTEWTQPALFAVGWALTELWASWGVRPDAVIGHSIGEITAATVAGVFSLEDAVALVAERSRLMGVLPSGGAMAAVRAPLEPVREAIADLPDIGIAALNGPTETVISGALGSVNQALHALKAAGIATTRLDVSHAFHSSLVEPMLDDFGKALAKIDFRPAQTPVYSNLTGRVANEAIESATYWREHVRRPVRFAGGLQAAAADGYSVFVELGPQAVLSGMGARTLPQSTWLPSLEQDKDPRTALLTALAGLIGHGIRPRADRVWEMDRPYRVDLPTTPAMGPRYWLEPIQSGNPSLPSYAVQWVDGEASGPLSGTWWVEGLGIDALRSQGVVVHEGIPEALSPGDRVVLRIPASHGAVAAWAAGPERVRSLWARVRAAGAVLWLVTEGAVAVDASERPEPGQAAIWGLGRVLSLEDPDAWGGLVDLGPGAALTADAFSGEDQVAVRQGLKVPRLVPREVGERAEIPAGSWLITGGFGGLGRAVAGWLVDRGATALVLASRSGGAGQDAFVSGLSARATVQAAALDVTDAQAVRALVESIDDLVGVVHCAGTASPGPVDDQNPADFALNFAAKALGAEALDAATRDRPLAHFVLFSSIAATWGSAGLGAYAAANAWVDALAQRRRADRLPGLSIAWGPWAEAGLVSADERRRFARMGIRALPVADALSALGQHLGQGGHRVVADVDWATFAPVYSARRDRPFFDTVAPPQPIDAPSPATGLAALPADQRQSALRDAVSAEVRAVLGLDPGAPLDPRTGLFDLGLDSLMAVELHRRLRDRVGLDLPATVAFDHPRIDALVAFASERLGWGLTAAPRATAPAANPGPIAIVGWSARFPGAPDAAALEALLFESRTALTPGSDRAGGRVGGYIDGIDCFDADFFGIGPTEAAAMDPQQRLVLQGAVEALECAAIDTSALADRPVGVFLGLAHSRYWDRTQRPDSDAWPWSGVGNEPSFAAGRIAYSLGLRGPALAVNTACSSSLVAVHLAVQALRRGECELALAGGVNVLLSPEDSDWLAEIGALSGTACSTFDSSADGYVRAEGCGMLALQPLDLALAAGRPILGVIRGTAIGHGGAAGGLTVPNGPAQADVIRRALTDAGANPEDVGYLECHGTGTPLGDPIEVGALKSVFHARSRPLVLGAAKANLGHAETAAGVAGLIAATLVLRRGTAPQSPLLSDVNPRLPLDWPVQLPDQAHPVTGLAGVSSFGISGTNAHVVLERAPEVRPAAQEAATDWLIAVSAHSEAALQGQIDALHAIDPTPALARTLAVGRAARAYRRAAVGGIDAVRGSETTRARAVRVGWLFTGQGAQRVGMARELRSIPVFREAIERAAAAFDGLVDPPLLTQIDSEAVHQTAVTQPALFAVEYALAQTLLALGCQPAGMVGHSLGEWVAATVAGVISLEDAARAVAARGKAMADQPAGGAMIAVRAPETQVREVLVDHPGAELAAVNGPADCTISGEEGPVQAAAQALAALGVDTRPLTVSHAFHSARMQGALPAIAAALDGVALNPPTIPIYAGLDGALLGDRAADPGYWTAATRQPVRFGDAVAALAAQVDVLVELGPRAVLSGLAGRALPADGPEIVPLLRGQFERQELLGAIGRLWCLGAVQTLAPIAPPGPLVQLPSVSWAQDRHWIDAEAKPSATGTAPTAAATWAVVDDPNPERPVPTRTVNAPESLAELVQAVAALVSEPAGAAIAFRAPGALSAEGPADRAAAVGLVAVLRAERPDLDAWIDDPTAKHPLWQPWSGPTAPAPVTGTWLVTGASGALGGRVVRWLLAGGAAVTALSRTVNSELAALEGVTWVRADIDSEAGTAAIRSAPFDGAIHCAGIHRSGFLAEITPEDLAATFAAKVGGATNLAEHLPAACRLVLFGSATAWLGLPGQGAYAAANAVLDGIALRRPNTVSIAWGPWRAGMASDLDWQAAGVTPMPDSRALEAMGQAIASAPARVAIIDLDPVQFQRNRGPVALLGGVPQAAQNPARATLLTLAHGARSAVLEGWVYDAAQAVLGHEIDGDLGFFEAGMDSLGAVELSRRLGRTLGLALPATLAFDAPSARALADALLDRLAFEDPEPTDETESVRAQPRAQSTADDRIAIVGLACRFPGAPDADALWELLASGGHAITQVPPSRWDADAWYDPDPAAVGKMYTRDGGFLDSIDTFDPELFGIAPREATALDPQQRLLLETAWSALDDAGLLDSAEGSRTGVYVGVAERGWLRRFEGDGPHYADPWSGTGAEASFAAGRVAHALGLRGPAIALNTTCSSSLVALHLAANAIRRGDCDQALAGGVHLVLDPESTAYLCRLGALSPTGRCHTFDAAADGYVRGEGCGVLVLKRLSAALRDGDRVRAVLSGSAVNHDGHASGLTVPSGPAQTEVIEAALADAGIAPSEVGWLQAHGTGTPLGDPIELRAAAAAYGERPSPLPVGTVKTAIGHCELAAGAAGAIAAILALEREQIPPHPLDTANPELDLDGWDLLPTGRPWPRSGTTRRVGVSAFGLSGTNAHLILEEGPLSATVPHSVGPVLLPLAAHSAEAFAAVAHQAETLDTADLAAGLPTRANLLHRGAVVAIGGAAPAIRDAVPTRAGRPPRVAFLFTGQGSQWAGMHQAMAGLPAFDAAFDQALAALASADPTLADLGARFDDAAALGRTENTQPALWAFEVAAAAQWRDWGVEPIAVAGHSVGEISAATVAGALSLEDGARLVAARGRLMGGLPAGGAMLVAHCSEPIARTHLALGVEVTGVNDPEETALAGADKAVEATATALEAAGIAVTRLNVSHAFHTARMDPILDAFQAVAETVAWRTPTLTLVSTLTGQPLTALSPTYWRDHARQAVRFADAMRTLDQLGCDGFVECGPHPILVRMGQRTLGSAGGFWVGSGRRDLADASEALRSLGRWWERGGAVRWDRVQARRSGGLPAYPMQRRRLWPEGDRFASAQWTRVERWVPAEARPVHAKAWVVLGNGSLVNGLRQVLGAGTEVGDLTAGSCLIDTASAREGPLAGRIEAARTVAKAALEAGSRVWWVTRGSLAGKTDPDAVGFWAWARAVFAEHPELRGGLVDVEPAAASGRAQAENLLTALGHAEASLDGAAIEVPRIEAVAQEGSPEIAGSWLITGGLGGLGLQLASWLVDQGATRLLLTARTPLQAGSERAQAVDALRQRAEVVVGQFDAADERALTAFLDGQTLDGIAHLAGITDPQPTLDASPESLGAVIAGKLGGAKALDAWSRANPVRHFLIFGSIAAAWGSRELGGYGAANAWVGALARQRAADGLPGLTVHWGPWGGSGMVDEARAERLQRMGLHAIEPSAALAVLGSAMASGHPELIAAKVDWQRFLALTEATGPLGRFDGVRPAGRAASTAAIELPPAAPDAPPEPVRVVIDRLARQTLRHQGDLDPEQPLMELGFDSLMATELNNALLAVGVDVPLGRLLGGPSVEEIAIMAEARSAAAAPSPAPAAAADAPQPLIWTHIAALIVGAAVASAIWYLL